MSDITILTPTYNREKLLHKLYKSLCNQKDKEFEWIVCDDGNAMTIQTSILRQYRRKQIFPLGIIKKIMGESTRLLIMDANMLKLNWCLLLIVMTH